MAACGRCNATTRADSDGGDAPGCSPEVCPLQVHQCSQECQRLDWKLVHKAACAPRKSKANEQKAEALKLTHAGHVLTDVASVEACITDLYDNHSTEKRAEAGTICAGCNLWEFDVDTNIEHDMYNVNYVEMPKRRLNLCRVCLPSPGRLHAS